MFKTATFICKEHISNVFKTLVIIRRKKTLYLQFFYRELVSENPFLYTQITHNIEIPKKVFKENKPIIEYISPNHDFNITLYKRTDIAFLLDVIDSPGEVIYCIQDKDKDTCIKLIS